jgi:hypothetical protein
MTDECSVRGLARSTRRAADRDRSDNQRVIDSSVFIGGDKVDSFERTLRRSAARDTQWPAPTALMLSGCL